jgi:hypothetical protein
MDTICLIVAGIIRATLPASELTLAWRHSVEKTRWEERYRADGDHLVLTDARIEGFGAGMEPSPDAVLRGGWWTWQPNRVVPALTLMRFATFPDYTLCWQDRCRDLAAIIGPTPVGAPVVIRPCAKSP